MCLVELIRLVFYQIQRYLCNLFLELGTMESEVYYVSNLQSALPIFSIIFSGSTESGSQLHSSSLALKPDNGVQALSAPIHQLQIRILFASTCLHSVLSLLQVFLSVLDLNMFLHNFIYCIIIQICQSCSFMLRLNVQVHAHIELNREWFLSFNSCHRQFN